MAGSPSPSSSPSYLTALSAFSGSSATPKVEEILLTPLVTPRNAIPNPFGRHPRSISPWVASSVAENSPSVASASSDMHLNFSGTNHQVVINMPPAIQPIPEESDVSQITKCWSSSMKGLAGCQKVGMACAICGLAGSITCMAIVLVLLKLHVI